MIQKILNDRKGSLLLEILLALAIVSVIIGSVSTLIMVSLKSGQVSGQKSSAIGLAEEGLEAMRVMSEIDWNDIYLPPDGTGDPYTGKGEIEANTYYVYKKDNGGSYSWELTKDPAKGDILVNGVLYTRKIYIFNVNRNKTGERQICTGIGVCADGEIADPSTQHIKVKVLEANSTNTIAEEYLSRWKNDSSSQTDWSGGSGQTDFSNPAKYNTDDGNIDTGTPGSIKLKPL